MADVPGQELTLAPEIRGRVRQIELRTRRLVSSALSGAYRSTFRGSGIEFEEVRPYLPGDDARAIDWNVTARTGSAFVKSYREERQLTLQFLVDVSASMDFGSGVKTKRDVAAELVALLAFVAVAEQDQVGLCLFDREVRLHLPPRKEYKHVLHCVREVLATPARGSASDLEGAVHRQGADLRRRSLVFVVSDFLGSAGWEAVLARLALRHDLIAVRLFDPFEEELPKSGPLLLSEIESGALTELDPRSATVRAAWAAAAKERRDAVRAMLSRAHAERIEVSTRDNPADPVARFFRRRAARRGVAR